MDFRYEERFRAPQPGDIAGAVALYGPSRALTAAATLSVRRLAVIATP